MSTIWKVIIDVLIAIVGFFSVQGVWLLVEYFCFEVPFTNKLVSLEIINSQAKAQLLAISFISSLLPTIIINGLCILGAYFTRPIGFIIYAIIVVIDLVLFRPSKDRYTWSPYNIEKYVSEHSACMDMERFNRCEFIINK